MVSFWKSFAMCIPIYTKCRSCKFVHFVSPLNAKCRHFIYMDKPYIVNNPNDHYCETDLYMNVEDVRLNENLCGRNGTFYKKRIY